MKIIKRYNDCLLGTLWQKTYDIAREDLGKYIKLNSYNSSICISDLNELIRLNQQEKDFILDTFSSIENVERPNIKLLYEDIYPWIELGISEVEWYNALTEDQLNEYNKYWIDIKEQQ